MDWVTTLFALIPTILLLVQGTSCLRRTSAPLYVRRFGFLCGILAGLSFVLSLLLASGSLVLSAEFSMVMVQGSLAWFSLAVLLVGSALAAGMGLHICCLEAGRQTRLWWLLGPGVMVGFLATRQLLPLNTGDAEPFHIYAYDLWWPPLLIYLSACLVASISLVTWLFFRSPRHEHEDRPTFQPVLVLVAIAVIALSLAALVSLVSLSRPLALAGFVSAWILLAEALAGGPLRTIFVLLIRREFWPALRTRLTAVSVYVGSGVRALLSVNSWPAAVVKTLMGLCLLMVLSELPNAGETRIQPFKISAIPGRNEFGQSLAERNEFGESLSERVVNTLRLVQKELRKEIVLFLHPDAEEAQGEVSFALVSASDSTSLGSAALSKSDDLTVGSVKIPLSLLLAPIQGPIRWLLGVHLINGSLQAEQQGYSLLASSTAGETWKVTQQVTPIPSPDMVTSHGCRRWPATPPISLHDRVASLANEFAFKIMITDPTLAPTMTKSWEAFQSFKAGLIHWKEFEAQQNNKALRCAIALFREATAQDSGFAFAYYRLGLALQRAGQPDIAAQAFQASLKADSTFVPVHIALASILYDFALDSASTASTQAPSPEPQTAARKTWINEARQLWQQIIHPPAWAVSASTASTRAPSPEPQTAARKTRMNEARQLWQQIIHLPAWAVSVPNRASAYYGLCRQAARQARGATNAGREHYLAYYYCKQAAALYASLSDASRAKPAIKTGEASVLHTLGMTVGRLQRRPFIGQRPEWDCGRRELCQSPYSRSALRYYRQALALLPDDYRIRCSEARAAYVLDDPEPMHRLRADPGAHVALAQRHRKVAKDHMADGDSASGARSYLVALSEYQEAIDREPTHIEALTGYAFTFGEWRAHLWTAKDPAGPSLAIAQRVAAYARRAVKLAADKPDPVIEAMGQCEPGKVLLAQGRPTEASKELDTANGNHAYESDPTRETPLCGAEFPLEGMPDPASPF